MLYKILSTGHTVAGIPSANKQEEGGGMLKPLRLAEGQGLYWDLLDMSPGILDLFWDV